jgi:hypothetical protein
VKLNNKRLAVACLLLVFLISATGCAGLVMTSKAQQVVVTQTASAIKSCKQRGVVFALAPFSSLEQPLDQLKIRADGIGADTVVLLDEARTQTKDWSAKAYRCGNVVSRGAQPALEIEAARIPN